MADSLASRLADLPKPERDEVLASLTEAEREALLYDWDFWARPEQRMPDEPWSIVWISGGRRSGKTRAGAEAAAQLARDNPGVDGGIVAPTFQADALRKCVEGASGILKPLGDLVSNYNRSEGVIYLRTGGTIFATGAEKGAPHIQGENLGWCWCDEVGLWPRSKWKMAWEESIQFAVMMSPARIVCTGTPKAGHPLIKRLDQDETVIKHRLRTLDNLDHLDADTVARLVGKYEGTRLGKQELEGILIDEVEGALWMWRWIEESRWRLAEPPKLLRVVVGVDPSGGANEIGIVGAGIIRSPCPCGNQDERGPHFAVVEDRSLLASPERWGAAVVGLYHELEADRVIAERNFGADMVESTLRVADRKVPVTVVHASRGKQQRAEPISALYEQGRVHHLGVFPDLETEQTTWVPGDDWSPNRVDGVTWAITDLLDKGERKASSPTLPTQRIVRSFGEGR